MRLLLLGLALIIFPVFADAAPPLENLEVIRPDVTADRDESMNDLDEPPEADLKLAFTSSMFRLENKTSEVSNTLYSKPNLGAEFALGFQTTDRLKIWLGATLEHVEMESPEGDADISGSAQDFLGVHLLGRYKTGLFSNLIVSFRSIERPFSRPTYTGTNIDKAFVPEISVGVEWNLLETKRSFTWIIFDGIYSHNADSGQQDVKQGYGVIVGARFDYELEKNTVSLFTGYRHLKQDTTVAENAMHAALLSLSSFW